MRNNTINSKALLAALLSPLKLVITLAFLFSIILFIITGYNYRAIYEFISIAIGLSIYTSMVTLLGSLTIGSPVVIILYKLNYPTSFNSAISCGVTVLLISLFISNGEFNFFVSLFTFYGIVCGYAYMYGYQRYLR